MTALAPLGEDELEARCADALRAHGTPMADPVLGPMMRASPLFFAQAVLSGPPQAPYNGRLLFADHHFEWEDIVLNHRRFCILASRGWGKSWFHSFIVPLWRMARNGEDSGFIFSATEANAQRMLDMVREEIESNPKLQWLFPAGRRRNWTSSQLRCSNGHDLKGRGYQTRVRGSHPTYIVGDDVLSEEDFFSPTQREKSKEYWFSALTNMVTQHGSLGAVGTPMSVSDMYMSLKRNPNYHFRSFSALDGNEQSTWPEAWPTAYLKNLEREIGVVRFGRELRCNPISDDMSIMPPYLFHEEAVQQPTVRLGMPRQWWTEHGVDRFYIGVDFAFSSSVGADYFVILTIGLDDHDNRWIVDIYRAKGVPFGEQKNMIATYGKRYLPEIIHLEANQAQRIVADDLIKSTDLPIRKYVTGVEKHSLEQGIPSLRIMLENRKYRLPRGDARSIELTDVLMAEMTNFTWANGKVQSVGGHDDLCMSLFLVEQAIRRGGFSFAMGSDQGESPAHRAPSAPTPLAQSGIDYGAHVTPEDLPKPSGAYVMRNGVPVRA